MVFGLLAMGQTHALAQADGLTPPPPPPLPGPVTPSPGEQPIAPPSLPPPAQSGTPGEFVPDPGTVPPPPGQVPAPPSGYGPPPNGQQRHPVPPPQARPFPTPREGQIVVVPAPGARPVTPGQVTPAPPPPRRGRAWAPARRHGHRISLDVMGYGGEVMWGGAMIADWLYRGRRPFYTHVRLGPLAFGISSPDRIGVVDGSVTAGFDSRLLSIGGGVGMAYLRVDETRRRTQGMSVLGRFSLRAGALDGFHVAIDIGGTFVAGDFVATHGNARVRVPLRRGRLLDVVVSVQPPISWVQLDAGIIFRLSPEGEPERWRLRPHLGIYEIIDEVGRDGGPSFGVGAQLIYLLESED